MESNKDIKQDHFIFSWVFPLHWYKFVFCWLFHYFTCSKSQVHYDTIFVSWNQILWNHVSNISIKLFPWELSSPSSPSSSSMLPADHVPDFEGVSIQFLGKNCEYVWIYIQMEFGMKFRHKLSQSNRCLDCPWCWSLLLMQLKRDVYILYPYGLGDLFFFSQFLISLHMPNPKIPFHVILT